MFEDINLYKIFNYIKTSQENRWNKVPVQVRGTKKTALTNPKGGQMNLEFNTQKLI
jgi:hypothetical protein